MNLYLWQYIDKVSDNYHDGGGLLVIAPNEDRARELANGSKGVELKPEEMPELVIECWCDSERVFIFPDAGCC